MRDSSQIVICVAGMHRSGTSMIARLLNLCGMDLGPDKDLMPASPANPEGYWEHIWFNYYNNQILDFFRGAWDYVPVLPDAWVSTPGIDWVRREAAGVIARFHSPVWGWKDPRNSLTLPFWKHLIPGVKTVVCLRNPLDVANSLNKRGSSSRLFGLLLWWQYNSMLLTQTTSDERFVTYFDGYFRNGHAELDRLVKAMEIQATDAAIDEARTASKESLRHSVTSIADLEKVSPWPGLVTTYCKLLAESGDVCREAIGEEWEKAREQSTRWTIDDCCLPIATTGHELHQRFRARSDELEAMRRTMTQQAQQIGELNRQLEQLFALVAQVSAQRDGFVAERDCIAAENRAIRQSKTWKIMTRLGSVAVKTGLAKPA